jgi:HK97 gp10 family phage protein
MKTGITKWYGKQVFTLATKENVKAMHTAALLLERDVKTHFTLQGSGREYKRGGITHRASTPGQPPAIDTGTLRASIMNDVSVKAGNVTGRVGVDEDYIAAKAPVGTDVNYGLYLEVGTSRMSPRPYLRPALKRTRRKVNEIFRKANS